jgi:uncharacterized protein
MFVGVLRLRFSIPGARSLKDRRRVVLSLKERIIGRLKVSAAEVGGLDDPRRATLAVAIVSNEAAHCDRVLSEAVAIANNVGDALLTDRRSEVIPFGSGDGLANGIEGLLDTPLDESDYLEGDRRGE